MQDLRRRKFKLTEMIEGRNAVLEAFRSGKCVDKLFIWMAVRTDRSAPSQEKPENMIPL